MVGDKYKAIVFCNNCVKEKEIDVPRGKEVEEYLKEGAKCPTCGNSTLGRSRGE